MTYGRLKNRSIVVLALVCLTAIFLSQPLRSATQVALTPLVNPLPAPIGIDWFPATDQLIVSDHYDGGVGGNFAIVDRTTGAITNQLANPFGYTNEIYFASVRPGSPSVSAIFPVNHVFYAEGGGSPNTTCIGEMDGAGTVLNPCRFSLPVTETRIKRGGVEFDLAGVAGGDLIVVASNDEQDGPSTIYRINKTTGAVSVVLDVPNAHLEGIATVPNDTAKYGDWAGKILVGAERYASGGGAGAIFAIDPNCNNACTPIITQLNTPTEDIWVVPANSAFYGVDYASQRIYRGGPEQWTTYVGDILLAREHDAQLYIVQGPSHTVSQIYDGFIAGSQNAGQWEHTTFAPEATPRAKIEIAPNATNAVGQSHTFTVTLSKDPTGTGPFVAAAGEHVDFTLTNSNGAISVLDPAASTCDNAGPNTNAAGQCTIVFTSNSTGTVTGHATATLFSGTVTVQTNGVAPNSGDAVKTFVNANINITPATATNPVGTNHVLTITVNAINGTIDAGPHTATASKVSGPGSFVGPNTCTYTGGAATASCTVTITSAVAGTTVIDATSNIPVSGVTITRTTGTAVNTAAGGSANAQKIWQNSTVATTIHNAAHAPVTTVAVGTTVHDFVSVTGGATPTGNVTIDWFLNNACTGAPAANSGSIALAANGTVDATGFAFTVTTAGGRAFRAHYLGDATHPAADGPCEPLTVTGDGLRKGDTATIGFWHNKNGQAVINCLNGGSSSTALGNFLATTYPSLFGAGPNSISNFTGKTNSQIAAIYLGGSFFDASGQKVNAQIFGVALAAYVTKTSSGGTCGASFGFNSSAGGTGAKTVNVGSNGHLLGPGFVDNGTYTIDQLLAGANAAKAAGTFNANAWNEVMSAINETGDI
jgi:hypothetical protein